MVAATVVAVGVICATGGAAAPVAAAAAEGILAGAAGTGAAATGAATTGVAVASATGSAAAAGAVTGAAAGGTVASAAVGTVVASTSAAGVSACGSGAAAAASTGLLAGPVGWICLGAGENESGKLTFDCWKPLLHDHSTEASKGMLLKDVVQDSRIKSAQFSQNGNPNFPQIYLDNIWNETFHVVYVQLPCGTLAGHVTPCVN